MFTIRLFTAKDQTDTRALILSGLASRFGFADAKYTPDLEDIWSAYVAQDGTVLVATLEERIVGCGMLKHEAGSDAIGRIVRMSVDATQQGHGLGRQLGQVLLTAAREQDFTKVLVETNDDWHSAVRLYQSLGFSEVERLPNPEFGFIEIHMALDL